MAMRDLMPRGRGRGGGMGSMMGPSDMQSPMLSLRREIESLFDDMMRGGLAPFAGSALAGSGLGRMGGEQRAMPWPTIEITQNENDICIHAEVPGLNENDVELMIEDGVLTIRGEKKTETEDQERGYSERYYGQFERRIALPPGVDEENAQADFNNGVLSITLHKTQQAERARRIPIGGMRGQGMGQERGQPQGLQQAASSQWTSQQQGQTQGQTGQSQTGQSQTGQSQTGHTQPQSEDQQGEASRPSGQQTQRGQRSGREPPRQPQE